MKAETKFNINDEVYFIDRFHNVNWGKIILIEVKQNSLEIKKTGEKRNLIPTGNYRESFKVIEYTIKVANFNSLFSDHKREEHNVFSSKEQLLKSL